MTATQPEMQIVDEAEAFEQLKNDCLEVLQCIDEEELINEPLSITKQYLTIIFSEMLKKILFDLLKFYINGYDEEEEDEEYFNSYVKVLFDSL